MSKDGQNRPDEAGLIRRLQKGDLSAFDAVFEKHRRGILAYVLGMCRDRELAEDIVQDCFVKLVSKIGKINPSRGAGPWLYRTARNRTIDIMRHRSFEVLPGDEALTARGELRAEREAPTPADAVSQEERSGLIMAAVNRLPANERETVLLRFYGGLTFEETARVLNRPLGTVLWQVRNALKRLGKTGILREILNETGE